MFEFMNVTKALADENRVRILLALNGRRELCVCQLIDMLELAPSTVSKHLTILRQARLILSRKEGRWIYYRLNTDNAFDLVSGALDWVTKSIQDDPRIAADTSRLDAILSQSSESMCSQ